MAEYPFAENDPREGLFEHSNFLGLRNNVGDEGFGLGDLVTATNVDINDSLELSRRKGYSAPVVTGVDRDLWASGSVCLGVGSNALKLIGSNYGTTVLRTGLSENRDLDYEVIGDRVYYANGVETGCIQNSQHRTWGITVPGTPTMAATGGTLLAGDYQVAVTYLRSDGQESGTHRAGMITLAAVGGIALSGISVSSDPGVVYKNVYATTVGGMILYRCGTIPNAQTTFTVAAVQKNSTPLMTQFMGPPPAGEFINSFKGWMLVARGRRIYPSESYAPELFDARKGIAVNDRITMLKASNDRTDGVWLGTTNNVIWMGGADPSTWDFRIVADYGVIPGTAVFADAETFGDGSNSGKQAVYFATTRGLCIGMPDGVFKNITESRFAYPARDRGASIVRRHRGSIQFLCTLEGIATAGNVAA